MYVLADLEEYHGLWLAWTILSFSNIGLEICVYYRINVQVPDESGMIVRQIQKQDSFIRTIPVDDNDVNTDDKPLINSMDESAGTHQIKELEETKVLYIMILADKDDSTNNHRKSEVTAK
jgi:hypothetical protein